MILKNIIRIDNLENQKRKLFLWGISLNVFPSMGSFSRICLGNLIGVKGVPHFLQVLVPGLKTKLHFEQAPG